MRIYKHGVLAAFVGCALSGVAQTSAPPVKDDLFAGTEKFAQGASSVTQIDMDPESLSKVEGKDGLKARRMVLSVVHTYEYDKPGMYKIEDVEAFRKKLETGDWHCSVHIRDNKKGESVDVCNKRRTDELTEQATITVDAKSLTFIHTIKREGNWRGTSEVSLPVEMRLIGPEMKAEMAVTQAEMRADMAAMRPEMNALALEMKNFKGPDPEQMRQLHERLTGLGYVKELTAPTPPPQP